MLFCLSCADTTAPEPSKSESEKYLNQRSDFVVKHFLRPFFPTSIKLAMNTYLSPCFEFILLQVFYNLPLNINNNRSIPLSVGLSYFLSLVCLCPDSLECCGRNPWTNYKSQYPSTVPCLFYWLALNATQFLMLSRVFPL